MAASVEGIPDVVAAFREAEESIRELVGDHIETAAAIIESEAKRRVPYDEGDLERSYQTKLSPRRMMAVVGSDLVYARFQELGTLRVRPQPHLYPAFRWGSRYLRREMKGWGSEVGARIRGRTRRNRALRRRR